MTIRVGIVLPVYNAQNTLDEAVSSVLRQTHEDFLLVIVNDGSTDNSRDIIEALRKTDSRILALEHANHGAGYTRNRGIDLVAKNGLNYVAFLDADDVWTVNKLEYQVNVVNSVANVDVVVTDMTNYDESHDLESQQIAPLSYLDIPDIFETLCLHNFTFQPVTALVKTNLFVDIMKYSESPLDQSGEDYLPFLYFAFSNARFVRIPLPLYRERRLSGSLQRSSPGYKGSGARVRAIQQLRDEYGASPLMTAARVKILEAAEDRYRTWILASVRRSKGYGEAIRESWIQFPHFYRKSFFFRELVKAFLYRP